MTLATRGRDVKPDGRRSGATADLAPAAKKKHLEAEVQEMGTRIRRKRPKGKSHLAGQKKSCL